MKAIEKARDWAAAGLGRVIAGLLVRTGADGAFFNRVFANDSGEGRAEVTQPYNQSTWARAGVSKIAGECSWAELYWEDARQGTSMKAWTRQVRPRAESDVLPPLDLVQLAEWWQEPAEGMDGPIGLGAFMDLSIAWLKLSGEAVWVLDDTWLVPGMGSKGKIMIVPPCDIHPVVEQGVLLGWRTNGDDGKQVVLIPSQVVRIRVPNPHDPLRSVGDLKPAANAVETEFLSGKFAATLARSNGDTGPYIYPKGQSGLTQEQRTAIKMQLMEKRRAASRGEFAPVFFSGEIEVKDPQVHVPDEAFFKGRLMDRHEIFIALGVPASMADVTASYSVGSASDRYRLITETCMPTLKRIGEVMQRLGRRMTGRKVTCCWDLDEHPVMQEVHKERMETAKTLWMTGMPMQQVSEYLGLGLPEYPGWDQGYLPTGVVAVAPADAAADGAPNAPTPDAPAPDAPADGEAEVEVDAVEAVKMAVALRACGKGAAAEAKGAAGAMRKEMDTAVWDTWLDAFHSKCSAVLFKVRCEAVRQLASAKADDGIEAEKILPRWDQDLVMAFEKVAGKPLDLALREKAIWLADLQRSELIASLERGLHAGESAEQLAGRLRADFNQMTQAKAFRERVATVFQNV